MSYFGVTLEIARQTLRLLLQNRLYWVLLVLMVGAGVLAAGLARLLADEVDGRDLFCLLCWWLLGVVLVPWTTMYFAVHATHGDIEDRTVQYLFLRPVPRTALLLGKWLAAAVLCAFTAALGVLSVFAGVAMSPDVWQDGVEPGLAVVFIVALALMAAVLSGVATLFSARFHWPLVWSTGYIIGVQLFIGNLPAKASIRVLAVADPVRRYVLDGVDPGRRLARRLWPSERQWDENLVGSPLLHLATILFVCLALALFYYRRSEYDSRPRE
ncbi:MAG: ABC transporter permease [Planctomycetota bacterium]|nr:ABC transporter permease [Planctomycetota bacterium]